jgi:hypothetical protein
MALHLLQISAERCTPFCKFLQKFKFLQKSKISAERCTPFCKFLQKFKFLRFMQKFYISAERCAPFCRNFKFLQKLQKGVSFCRKAHLSAISAEI